MILEFKLDKKTHMKINLLMILHKWPFYASLGIFLVLLVASLFLRFSIYYSLVLLGFIILVSLTLILNNALAPKNSSFFLPRTYSFTDEGVTVKFSNSERKARWSTFLNWKRISNYYVLYLVNSGAIVIPESAVPAGELTAFENLLNQNIKTKKSTR
jgi:YcxB-like protein